MMTAIMIITMTTTTLTKRCKHTREGHYIRELVCIRIDFYFVCRLVSALVCGALLSFPFVPFPLNENGARTCNSICPSTLGPNAPQSQLEFSVLKDEPILPAASSFASFSKLEELGPCSTVEADQCSSPRHCRRQTPEDSNFCPLNTNSLPEEEVSANP